MVGFEKICLNFITILRFVAVLKILIIRFSSIGDIVLTSPVVRCLKEQLPGVEIHYVTKRKFAKVIAGDQRIHKIHELGESFSLLASQLKAENFDLVIDLHNNLRSRRLKWALRRKSISFKKLNFKKWLFVRLHLNLMPKEHIVNRYLQTCQTLNVRYDEKGLDFFISEELASEYRNQLPTEYGVYAIGGTWFTKKMPPNKIIELVQNISMPIVLIGDASDRIVADKIGKEAKIINFCGNLSISESAHLMSMAKFVIAHDTGMMHIAAALKKKVVSIWGNTSPDFGMWPLFPTQLQAALDFRSEFTELSCRPCSKIGFNDCPKGHFRCMLEQDLGRIVENLKD